MFLRLLNIKELTPKQEMDLVQVALTAARYDDEGVLEWANRAINDARSLGHMRDRDVATLNRLERTYASDFYRGAS